MSNLLAIQRTRFTRNEETDRKWIVIDASGQRLGRLASRIAHRLRGKHRSDYAPHQNIGDHIVVTNAVDVVVSGNKKEQKIYYKHTGYTGNLRQISFKTMLAKNPEKVIQLAVKRMLPSGALGRNLLGSLYVYPNAKHPHSAQKPQIWELSFK